jgi:hypothetical protein
VIPADCRRYLKTSLSAAEIKAAFAAATAKDAEAK